MDKNIKDLEFNDIGFVEISNRKALILFDKTKEKAENLYNELRKGFNLKHRIENSGTYTIAVDIHSYSHTVIHKTSFKKENYPQLLWLDNSNITDLLVAYGYKENPNYLEPALPLNPHTTPN